MAELSPILVVAVVFSILASFTVSASAGLGGSLILVPSLALVLGTKEGVALAALLLGANNILKVVAYRKSLPLRAASLVIAFVVLGAFVGAALLVVAPEAAVGAAVVTMFVLTLVAERRRLTRVQRVASPVLAFFSGASSGFSGTSGPLKGAALRNLSLDKAHFVGAASLASLAGDLAKTAVFAKASLLDAQALQILVVSIPLMFLGTYAGHRLNESLGEVGFAVLFWSVMLGYSVRLALVVL